VSSFECIEAVVAVELVGIPDNGLFAVVPGHHVVGQQVDSVLKPAFLCIDKQPDAVLMSTSANSLHARHGAGVSSFFSGGEWLTSLDFLQDGYIGHTGYFEYRKRDVLGAVSFLNGGQNFVAGVVVAAVAAFALYRVIEDGANVVFA
jgi:hypothetical protein